jgi:citrate lyase beta subunit
MRSLLIFPLDNIKFLEKAVKSQADALIFDLEDSVSLDKKNISRKNLSKIDTLEIKKKIFIRVNSDLNEFIKDLRSCVNIKIYGFVITKCENEKYLEKQINLIKKIFKKSFKLILLIETPLGIVNLPKMLSYKNLKYITGLMFGHEDFSINFISYLEEKDEFYDFYRKIILLNSKSKNILTFDSPCLEIKSQTKIKNYFKKSFQNGFDGSLIIHPRQINFANQLYLPTEEDCKYASKVIKFSNTSKSIFMYKGKFIGPPILKRMKRIVEKYLEITKK